MHIDDCKQMFQASGLKENTVLSYCRDIQNIKKGLDGVEIEDANHEQLGIAFKILELNGMSTASLMRIQSSLQKYLSLLKDLNLPHATMPSINHLNLNFNSLKIKRKNRCSTAYIPRKFSLLADPLFLRERYLTLKMGMEEIATEVGCTKQAVYKAIKKHGIKSRSHSQAWRASAEKENSKINVPVINEAFFSKWSSSMAYVLGIILTDGNLYMKKNSDGRESFNSGKISISQKDPELLNKIGNLMGYSGKLYFRERREFKGRVAGELYIIGFSSDRIVADLLRLGLRPRKSLTMRFPDIPKEFISHFIRGCWDGDGSVYIDKKYNQVKASFVSGSLFFVEKMVKCLVAAGLPDRTIHQNNHSNKSYYFRYTGVQVPMLYHYLYDNVPDTEYLERKYNLFQLSLEMNQNNIIL